MSDHAELSAPRVNRDRNWNEREFGAEKWPAVAELIEEALAQEDPPQLSRVVSFVSRRERGAGSALDEHDVVVGGMDVRAARSVVFGAYQALIADSVVEACRDEPDLVIELGAGWSRNLFCTWLAGGPANAVYVGA